ncbi:MAG: hypothetical protein D6794_09935 [Deltaproteobacteria bacterium]|nr:MAG: hypothetical protein D6794_09935 [Deltaproteobacteria bacterium]
MVRRGSEINEVSRFITAAIDGVPKNADAKHVGEALIDAYRQIEAASRGEDVNFVPSGYTDFDTVFGGLARSGLVIVAARPAMGKTSFALGLARQAAAKGPVLAVSMEMPASHLAMRLMSAEAGVPLQNLMRGELGPEDFRRATAAVNRLKECGLWINDLPSRDLHGVLAEARRFRRQHPDMRMLVIDYLTLMQRPQADRADLAIGEMSRALKVLAGEIDCPVVLLSQLNRRLEERPLSDRRPRMSDLRESGAIEQDADQIVFLYREEVYRKTPENEGLAEIIMAKNRNGRTGIVRMAWIAERAAFVELAGFEEGRNVA